MATIIVSKKKMQFVPQNKTTLCPPNNFVFVFWTNILGDCGTSTVLVLKSLSRPRWRNNMTTSLTPLRRQQLVHFTLFPAVLQLCRHRDYHLPERTLVCTHNSALQYSDLGNIAEVQCVRRRTSPLGRHGIYGKSLKTRHFLDNCLVSRVFF